MLIPRLVELFPAPIKDTRNKVKTRFVEWKATTQDAEWRATWRPDAETFTLACTTLDGTTTRHVVETETSILTAPVSVLRMIQKRAEAAFAGPSQLGIPAVNTGTTPARSVSGKGPKKWNADASPVG